MYIRSNQLLILDFELKYSPNELDLYMTEAWLIAFTFTIVKLASSEFYSVCYIGKSGSKLTHLGNFK